MRLNVDFSLLEEAVHRMGAESVLTNLVIDVRRGIDPPDPIDIQLGEGITVDLSEIQIDSKLGLLSYQGRQVLLYIQDHGWRIEDVLQDAKKGKKVHVADCKTLQEMKEEGRFQRYVATNDVGGEFHVTGQDDDRNPVEGKARLRVCKNCLWHLNYKGSTRNRSRVFREFKWSEFFDAYRTHFEKMPKRRAGTPDGAYGPDWNRISKEYKEEHAFKCEECRVDLKEKEHRRLLHVHHIDGVKTNNARSNLKALCAVCHGNQPRHEHMRVGREEATLIENLRRRQGALPLRV